MQRAREMYRQNRVDLGPPPRETEESVYEAGKTDFVEDLVRGVSSPQRREALYALGWFGDRRHAAFAAGALQDADPAVQRIALASFNRLTHQGFDDVGQAMAWWEEYRETFPRYRPDSSRKESSPPVRFGVGVGGGVGMGSPF